MNETLINNILSFLNIIGDMFENKAYIRDYTRERKKQLEFLTQRAINRNENPLIYIDQQMQGTSTDRIFYITEFPSSFNYLAPLYNPLEDFEWNFVLDIYKYLQRQKQINKLH